MLGYTIQRRSRYYFCRKKRRGNDNLEQQAQALFKSWFVDSPTSKRTEMCLSEIATFVGGYSYKGSELVNSSRMAMATIKNFERHGGFKEGGYKEIAPSEKLREEHRVQLFDILVAHTDLTQNAEVIGNAELLLTNGDYEDIIFSMDLVKVQPQEKFPYKFLLACLLKNPMFKKHCMGYVNGTTVLHLNKKALVDYKVQYPDIEEAKRMNDVLAGFYRKMAEILVENRKLTQLRDTLLPKVMSGELKIEETNR